MVKEQGGIMVFLVVMYECESWTKKKAEGPRIDAFELWCWRRLWRVPWTARRSNQLILKEIKSEYPLEGLMLKLKLQYFGHLMQRTNSLEKTLMLGKIEGRRRRGRQMMRWLDGITDSMNWVWASSGSWWWRGEPSMLQSMGSQRVGYHLVHWILSVRRQIQSNLYHGILFIYLSQWEWKHFEVVLLHSKVKGNFWVSSYFLKELKCRRSHSEHRPVLHPPFSHSPFHFLLQLLLGTMAQPQGQGWPQQIPPS